MPSKLCIALNGRWECFILSACLSHYQLDRTLSRLMSYQQLEPSLSWWRFRPHELVKDSKMYPSNRICVMQLATMRELRDQKPVAITLPLGPEVLRQILWSLSTRGAPPDRPASSLLAYLSQMLDSPRGRGLYVQLKPWCIPEPQPQSLEPETDLHQISDLGYLTSTRSAEDDSSGLEIH